MNSVHNNTRASSISRRNLPPRCSRIADSRPIALKTVPRTVFKAIASGNTLTESAALATMNSATGQLNPTGTTQALAYTYDAKNRLSRAQIGANTADFVSYKINAMGQRVQKTGAGLYAFNSSLTIDAATGLSPLARTINFNARYVYDEQGRLIGEYAPDGKLISETIWFNDLPIATLRPKGANAGTPLGQAGTTTGNPSNGATAANANNVGNNSTTNRVNVEVFYVHADHLGTPRTVTRSTVATGANAPSSATSTSPGAINKAVWRWDSDPFGTSLDNSKPTENPQLVTGTATQVAAATYEQNLRHTGQLFDAESGKYQNGFRDYAPMIGRYPTSDPIGLRAGVNTFGYVLQQPTRFTDRFGLDVKVCYYDDAAAGFGHIGLGSPGGPTYGTYPRPGENPLDGLGEVREDKQLDSSCKVIRARKDQDECVANCIKRRQQNPGVYSLFTRQCTSFVRECLSDCGLQFGPYQGPLPKEYYNSLPGPPAGHPKPPPGPPLPPLPPSP